MEHKVKHSVYRGHTIIKVTQESGRVTYDIKTPNGDPFTWAEKNLRFARLAIDCEF